MYRPGDLVVYGRTGVCRVEWIETREDGQKFYALAPLYQSCAILTPVEGKVFMRPVLTRQEAEELIDRIPDLRTGPREGAVRELTEHYQASIATHDCGDLVELLTSIYAKKRTAEREKRKFGAVDERFLQEGESLLHGELAAVLDIPVGEVPAYIKKRLKEREVALQS